MVDVIEIIMLYIKGIYSLNILCFDVKTKEKFSALEPLV